MSGGTRTSRYAYPYSIMVNTAGDRFVVNVWGVGYRLVDGAIE